MHITSVTKSHLHEAFHCQPVPFEDIQDDEVLCNHGESTFLIWPDENSKKRVVEIQVGILESTINLLMFSHGALVLSCLKPTLVNYHWGPKT